MITISNPLIGKNEIKAVTKVLRSHLLSQGKFVDDLEEVFSQFCGTKYAVATNNGTSALHTALYVAGIGSGDEVITTPFTFVATANAILMVKAKPVFIDIDPYTYNLNPDGIEKAITKKTRAIITVNLYGQPADYDKINKIAKKYKLLVIEDAAQSVNATYKNKKSGNLGHISCFSFYATKNITSGEGGMITTNNKNYYLKAKQFINHGQKIGKTYDYSDLGYNYRMTNIQASILLEQLKKVDWITRQRQKIANKYSEEFKKIKGIKIPFKAPNRINVFHQYTIQITKDFPLSRDKLIIYLQNKGIQTKVYYPKPLFHYPHIKQLSVWQNCPNAEKATKQVLSLPLHPSLTEKDLKYIITTIKLL